MAAHRAGSPERRTRARDSLKRQGRPLGSEKRDSGGCVPPRHTQSRGSAPAAGQQRRAALIINSLGETARAVIPRAALPLCSAERLRLSGRALIIDFLAETARVVISYLQRLRRSALRKGFAFPGARFLLIFSARRSLAGKREKGADGSGKAQPFRTAARRSRTDHRPTEE